MRPGSGEKSPFQHIRRDIFLALRPDAGAQGDRRVTHCLETGGARCLPSMAAGSSWKPSRLWRSYTLLPTSVQWQFQCLAATMWRVPFPSMPPFLWTSVSVQRQSLLWWHQRETLLQWQRDKHELPLSGFCDTVTKQNLIITFARPTVHVGYQCGGIRKLFEVISKLLV